MIKNLRVIMGSILLGFHFLNSFSQNDIKTDRYIQENNRWEGLVGLNVGSKFELIAFHAERINSYDDEDNLNIFFYQSNNSKVDIVATNIIMRRIKYRMVVMQRDWEQGWQKFSPWHTANVLIPNNIKANNLGVLIKNEDGEIYPAHITKHNEKMSISHQYKVYFHTPSYISTLTYKVFDLNGAEIYEGINRDEDEQSTFYLNINISDAIEKKMYKLKLDIVWDTGKSFQTEYFFYNSN